MILAWTVSYKKKFPCKAGFTYESRITNHIFCFHFFTNVFVNVLFFVFAVYLENTGAYFLGFT